MIKQQLAAAGLVCPACDVCGGSADAMWFGLRDIAICRDCAVVALPALIADAHAPDFIAAAITTTDRLLTALDRIEARFWRACYMAGRQL